MEHNPYAPTAASLDAAREAASHDEGEVASRARRFVNSFVDGIGNYLLSMAVTALVAWAYPPIFQMVQRPLTAYLYGLVVAVLYFFTFETLFGRTPGKFLTRTKVVSISGGRPSASQVMRRSLFRMVPFDAFSFLSRQPVGWHDRWSDTRVVPVD